MTDGRVLATRWQVERLRRPAEPGLVWLGFARPEVARFACLACGDTGWKQGVLRAEGNTLFLCTACASHQAHPPPNETVPAGFARRLAIHAATDPMAAAEAAARMVGELNGGVALDLGCGFGLAVDMVARRPGWVATGVDPGPLADLGADALGARVAQGGAGEAVLLGGRPADVVRAEGVLERSPDPLALLRALPALSRRGARWLIATADAARLYESGDPGDIRRLAAPPTRLLLSKPGFGALLRRSLVVELATAGIVREGATLRAGPNVVAAPDELLDGYLAARLADAPAHPEFAGRLRLAALERGGSGAGVEEAFAASVSAAMAAAQSRAVPESIAELFAEAPLHAGALLLQAGLALRETDPARGRHLLEGAAGLSQRAFALAPDAMQGEAAVAQAARDALATWSA